MSSFRIDRQYVSFETAEIHPVRKDDQEIRQNAAVSSDSGAGGSFDGDFDAAEKRIKDAEAKAGQILDKAQFEAELIMSKARKTSSAIIKEAQDKAGELLVSAKREGYKDGVREAQDSADKRRQEEEQEFGQLTEKLKTSYLDLVESMRGDIVSIVTEITKKIIGIKLSESDAVFMGLVGSAIDQLKQAETISIHVCPEDYARYFLHEPVDRMFDDTNAKITVMEEESYSPGDLIVESECEVLDLSVSKQIKKVENALENKGE